jgi:hypothetical protein
MLLTNQINLNEKSEIKEKLSDNSTEMVKLDEKIKKN